MRCVDYDEEFKRRIIRGQRADSQSVNAKLSRRRGRRSESPDTESPAGTQRLKRRRRNENDSESPDLLEPKE